MRMVSVNTQLSRIIQRLATVHIAATAFVGAFCIFMAGQLFAQTPDSTPPFQEIVCNGLTGKAFGLCNAYCEAQDCGLNPKPSCELLRINFEKLTGSPVFPCDIPPLCEELNPTQDQIDMAVTEAMNDIDNPWGNVTDFQLFLNLIEVNLGCTLQNPNGAASLQTQQKARQQQTETCAAEGVSYCGPGTSDNGRTLETESACLNEACCRHDTCYGVNCIQGNCYWTTQTQECDEALRASCYGEGSCEIDTKGRIICALVRYLDDRENPEDRPACNSPPSCEEGPQPDCAGQTCDTFTNCKPGSGCIVPVCGSLAEGGGLCVEGMTQCDGLADCTTSADCGGKGLCFVDSCCGRPVCVPASAFCPDIGASQAMQGQVAQRQAIVEGPTIGCR